tara:strand:- start:380 stop:544 length:165 start_codon:yes stop_codon:yes gene_type:complete
LFSQASEPDHLFLFYADRIEAGSFDFYMAFVLRGGLDVVHQFIDIYGRKTLLCA